MLQCSWPFLKVRAPRLNTGPVAVMVITWLFHSGHDASAGVSPPLWVYLRDISGSILIVEVFFFYSRRLLHHPKLYGKFYTLYLYGYNLACFLINFNFVLRVFWLQEKYTSCTTNLSLLSESLRFLLTRWSIWRQMLCPWQPGPFSYGGTAPLSYTKARSSQQLCLPIFLLLHFALFMLMLQGSHPFVGCTWSLLALYNTRTSHSGYALPGVGDPMVWKLIC